MAVLIGFAFISGIITILSPCILPVLPVVLSGSVGGGKARPLGIVSGFIVSFVVFTLALSAIVTALHLPGDFMRGVAVVVLLIFGVIMIVPALKDLFMRLVTRVVSRGTRNAAPKMGVKGKVPGYWSGIPIGLSLGLVWTPCVGPIMGSVIALANTQHLDGGAVLITLAYTLGTSIPMLAVMLGGRTLLNKVPALQRNTEKIQKVFGVLMVLVSVAIFFKWDLQFQQAVLTALPNYGSGLTAIEKAGAVNKALDARDQRPDSNSGTVMSAVSGSAAGVVSFTAGNASGALVNDAVFHGAPRDGSSEGILGDFGAAPQLPAGGSWFNLADGTKSLTMDDLKGKVVLLDFWTYSCINCVRTMPYLRAWYKAYHDKGLVILGVHSPEFEFEKNPSNVKTAIGQLGVAWPVVQDNNYAIWTSYDNHYWPAHYLIDAKGRVRSFHFGEGDYDKTEALIRQLLLEAGTTDKTALGAASAMPDTVIEAQTPETYLGYGRGKGFTSEPAPVVDTLTSYKKSGDLSNGRWALDGKWQITKEYSINEGSAALTLKFDAKNVFLVMEPDVAGSTVSVTVDGKKPADTPDVSQGLLKPVESRAYQVVGLAEAGTHELKLSVSGKVRVYSFTFG